MPRPDKFFYLHIYSPKYNQYIRNSTGHHFWKASMGLHLKLVFPFLCLHSTVYNFVIEFFPVCQLTRFLSCFLTFFYIINASFWTVAATAELLSRVWLFVTPWTVACQAPLSMGILQARILEWVAMPSSRGSSQSRYRAQVFHIAGWFFPIWATRERLLSACSQSLHNPHYLKV